MPVALLIQSGMSCAKSIHYTAPLRFGVAVEPLINRFCKAYPVRCYKGGYYGDNNNYRIEVVIHHIKALSHCRNDKRELTYLAETESALQRIS